MGNVKVVKHKNPATLKKLAIAFALVITAATLYFVFLAPYTAEAKTRAQLESTRELLMNEGRELDRQKILNAKQAAEHKKKVDALNKKLKETTKKLQAKRKANTALAAAPDVVASAPVQAAPRPTVKPTGTCASWIAQAGVADVANANELIRRESGCNPNAVNPSSGACGVAQELPCGKSGCSLGDGACQVRWMNQYVHDRYGSWAAAVAFHNANNWY